MCILQMMRLGSGLKDKINKFMSLKPLKTIEDNLDIKDLADSVYGYAGPDNIIRNLGNLTNLSLRSDINVTARKDQYYFKINKYSDTDIRFEGYIGDEAELLINQNKGLLESSIPVFPKVFKEFKNLKEFSLSQKNIFLNLRCINDGKETIFIIDIKKQKDLNMNSNHIKKTILFSDRGITNNQTFAFIVGTIILFIISYLLYKYTGQKISDFI